MRSVASAGRWKLVSHILWHIVGVLIAIGLSLWSASFAVAADEGVVWSLGKTDGSAIEFAPGARKELVFTIGTSVPSRDFAGHQDGTIGADPAASG